MKALQLYCRACVNGVEKVIVGIQVDKVNYRALTRRTAMVAIVSTNTEE